MGKPLADKVAEGNIQHVSTALPMAQWTDVSAITAIASLSEEGELYIGDNHAIHKHCMASWMLCTQYIMSDTL